MNLAKEESSGKLRALKKIDKSKLLEKETRVSSLINEIRALRLAKYIPGVVSLMEVRETDNSIYLILEYVEGQELFDLDSITEVPYAKRIILIESLTKTLASLSKLNIVHKDLKPSNIISDGKSIKILDFGLGFCLNNTVYPINQTAGTPGFLAPEITKCKETLIHQGTPCFNT